MLVKPVYGMGWFENGSARDVPVPFEIELIEADERVRYGTVTTVGHEFEGRVARLSSRHREANGAWNVVVEREGLGGDASGFAADP